jgi:hypothetical protein
MRSGSVNVFRDCRMRVRTAERDMAYTYEMGEILMELSLEIKMANLCDMDGQTDKYETGQGFTK